MKDISLTDYIQIRHPVFLPHTAGRWQKRQFRKAQMPIVERVVNACVQIRWTKLEYTTSDDLPRSLMMNGRNNGKKLLAVRIVAHAFEVIHLLSDQNPIQVRPQFFERRLALKLIVLKQVMVDAIVNTGPREDSTRIGSQGTVRRQAVDVSPLRRVNQAISLLTIGVRDGRTIHACVKADSDRSSRPVKAPSETSSPSPNAWLTSSSTLLRARPTPTPLRSASLAVFRHRTWASY